MTPIKRGPLKDSSGTLANANTSQLAFAARINCVYILIQNISDITLWFNWDAPAVIGDSSLELAPGAWYENPPHLGITSALYVIGGTATKAYTIKYATG